MVSCNSPSKTKTHSSPFGRMGSSLDNLGRYISLSSEGFWVDPLQFRAVCLLGYLLMEYGSQDSNIIASLGLIVKCSSIPYKQCYEFRTHKILLYFSHVFFSSPCRISSTNKDLGGVPGVRTLLFVRWDHGFRLLPSAGHLGK